MGTIMKWLRYHTPRALRDLVKRVWPREFERIRVLSTYMSIDWSRTRAFADEQQGMIWINLVGREPQGVVTPGSAYNALMDDLMEKLSCLRDAEGEAPVLSAVRRRNPANDPADVRIPDILVLPSYAPPYEFLPSDLTASGDCIVDVEQVDVGLPKLRGTHRPEGLFIAAGDCIVARPEPLSGLSVVDVAPTVLHALGCPLSPALDGCPQVEIFRERRTPVYEAEGEGHTPRAHSERGDAADDQAVLDRLRGLGYID
jgi:predicted AlkP superfamily phosphohydrolase/phosphomutase